MPRSWSSLLGWVGLVALVVVAVATAGLGGTGGGSDARRPARPSPSASASPAPLSAAAVDRVVRRVQLRESDLPSRFGPVVTRDRTERDAEDSVRLCGAPVPDDRLRVGGDRAAFTDPAGQRVRVEVAVYAPGGAAAAVSALQAAPTMCARRVPPGRVELPSTLALEVLTGDARDRTRHELMALRRGEVLVLVAVDAPPGSRGLAVDVARALAGRLDL